MWKLDSPHRFYADPAASLAIGLIIMGGSIPLSARRANYCVSVRLTCTTTALKSSRVLLEAAPKGMDLRAIKEDLQAVGFFSRIWDHLTG